MIRMVLRHGLILFALAACFQNSVYACSVCFGDPTSPLTIGAKAGVFFMFGVIGLVLAGIFAVTLFWMRRAKLVEVQHILHGESSTEAQKS